MLKPIITALVAASALPLASGKVFDKLNSVPREWSWARAADSSDKLKLRVSVKQQNVPTLEGLMLDMSTPDHPSYGSHMSGQTVLEMLRPAPEASETVLTWLKSYNVSGIHDDGNWLAFVTDVATASQMLDADFAWFSHRTQEKQTLRTLSYSVPNEIARHIDYVQPTTKFSNIKSLRSTIHQTDDTTKAQAMSVHADWASTSSVSSAGPGGSTIAPPDAVCNTVITPQCLLKLYNIHYAADATNGNKVSFGSFLEQYARYLDLNLFETTQALYAAGQSFNVTSFNGGLNDQTSTSDATEANLDVQYIIGVGHPVPVTEFSTAGRGPQINDANEPTFGDNEPYMEFLAGILALPDSQLPHTLSISYGEDEQTWPKDMAISVCNGFMQLGARGVSVLFSSGDSGPGGICTSNDGNTATEFIPNFPVSCPFVTGIGGTRGVPESAVSFSGGGSQTTSPNHRINPKSGRGYPDVSAQGLDFLVVSMGVTEPVSGTSASSPTFAGVVALLNSARISSGQKPLGFINPWLYSVGYAGLNDIVTGSSTGCANEIPGASFAAVCGWDPATGLGTPDFGKLLALVAPQQCKIGGPLANQTSSACNVAANSAASSNLVTGKTLCPVTRTTSTPLSTSSSSSITASATSSSMVSSTSSMITTTKAPSCNADNCYRALAGYQRTSVSSFCSAYLASTTLFEPTQVATCGPSRISSACSCLATSTAAVTTTTA